MQAAGSALGDSMPAYICPQGHQWETLADLSSSTSRAPAVCPVCGVTVLPPGLVTPPLQIPPSTETAATVRYSRGEIPPAPPRADAPGSLPAAERRTIPGYEILGELGRGGMGVVYKARQLSLNRLVALKMILAGEHAGKEHLARFRLEAETVARLQHPHIVQIYEVGQHEGRPY